jgi:ubiquinone biosynthesis protein UbiJ
MLHTFQQLVGTALMERCTLLANHVLTSEPAAVRRLQPHAGRCIQWILCDWPGALPPLPELSFVVTPAGLLEWCGPGTPPPPDLKVSVDMSNPARVFAQGLTGRRPQVDVSGDAGLAADVSWLMDNLRWDVQDDLARIVGQAGAAELARVGAALAAGLAARARGEADGSCASGPRAEQPVR